MSDTTEIEAVIRIYFECMHESSAEKTHAAFHPKAMITGYLPNGLQQMTVADFAGFVASQQPSPKAQGVAERLEIVSLEIAGNTAVARVRDDYLGMTFLDTLSFLKTDDAWQIYNKLFHVEGTAA